MTTHLTGTQQEWESARLELLTAEKELTRRSDELARKRQELPWVRVEADYRFDTVDGPASLADLFHGRSQLLIYHFMFGPDFTAGCPSCSNIADGFDGYAIHLANHDVTLAAVSRAPLHKLLEYERRMGWSFPWASSYGSEFNVDFNVTLVEQQPAQSEPPNEFVASLADASGTDAHTFTQEGPGMSAFVLDDGVVYHTYSTYRRGLDVLWGMFQWLDRAPKGRNETEQWWRRHDEYATS
ncbi:MAG TPA: DUF899 domain-containing protein [Microbacteriaceae bacterium]|nr:DUF899 domain-containing protein [Microbacteriaceae bacterium]